MSDLQPGDKVAHATFGYGRVEAVEPGAATVRFGKKARTILLSHLECQESEVASRSADAPTLFDAYLMVDWSASNTTNQGPNSVWYCLLEPDHGRLLVMNPGTRDEAYQAVQAHLTDLVSLGRRVLVGFDFPYGYPAGTAAQLGLPDGAPWRAIWELLSDLLEDAPNNRSNRFEVAAQLNGAMTTGPAPFWGCPRGQEDTFLSSKRPKPWPANIPEYRLTDRVVSGPKSLWQLYGHGSVGSQALTGIPRLAALRDHAALSEVSRVWPFETEAVLMPLSAKDAPLVLHAEIYPSLVPPSLFEEIIDAGQVRALAEHFSLLDEKGALGPLLDLSSLPLESREVAVNEEGWILGVPPPAQNATESS